MSSRAARTTSLTVVALATTLSLAVAACGDDDESSGDSSGGETALTSGDTETATTEATTPVDADPATGSTTATPDSGATGGDPADDAWREQMNALCDEARTAGTEIEEPETVGDLGRAFGDVVDIGDTLIEGAAELETPESVQGDVDELIALWEEKREQLNALQGQFEDAGYSSDDALDEIPEAEADEVAGDAVDQSELQAQSEQLGITCFGND